MNDSRDRPAGGGHHIVDDDCKRCRRTIGSKKQDRRKQLKSEDERCRDWSAGKRRKKETETQTDENTPKRTREGIRSLCLFWFILGACDRGV
mmetsp:Transcript_36994/g.72760  ORF Transcript_36994/g.72760 Transcript_36994/m.72760 type:complete len:92 (+) Transcript_36994:126-401(+)